MQLVHVFSKVIVNLSGTLRILVTLGIHAVSGRTCYLLLLKMKLDNLLLFLPLSISVVFIGLRYPSNSVTK